MGRTRAWLAVLVVGVVAGCSSSPDSGGVARFLKPAPADQGPPADSPQHLLDAYQWCWEHRNEARYRELLAADFVFECAAGDSSGNPYHANPWRREDELIFAHNLFANGSASEAPAVSITFTFGRGNMVDKDPRPGKTFPVHQSITTTYNLTIQKSDGTGVQCTGAAGFYVVRADSAQIPSDVGFGPSQDRWLIEGMFDIRPTAEAMAHEGAPGHPHAMGRDQAMPTRSFTLCDLRALYR